MKQGQRKPLALLFWTRVDRRTDGDCWIWLGARRLMNVWHEDIRVYKTIAATKVAWYLTYGEWPKQSLVSVSSCLNPHLCVNPKHFKETTRGKARMAAIARNKVGRAAMIQQRQPARL